MTRARCAAIRMQRLVITITVMATHQAVQRPTTYAFRAEPLSLSLFPHILSLSHVNATKSRSFILPFHTP